VFPVLARTKPSIGKGDLRWKSTIANYAPLRNPCKFGSRDYAAFAAVEKKKLTKYQRALRVKDYFEYTDTLKAIALQNKYVLEGELYMHVYIPYPESTPAKKRIDKAPMTKKPDWDNVAKAFQDAMADQDSTVHVGYVRKFYTTGEARIVVFKGDGIADAFDAILASIACPKFIQK